MIELLFYLVIVGLIFAVLFWGLQQMPLPAPFAMVAKVILVLFVVVILVSLLAQVGGINDGFNFGFNRPSIRLN